MIYFFTIASPGRSGTMWYSRALTTEHSYCFHELNALLHPYPSDLGLKTWFAPRIEDHNDEQAYRRWLLQLYPDYFKRLWERAEFGQHIVGNSDAAIISKLPALWLMWPDMKFVFSVRNGINCVQSRFSYRTAYSEMVVRNLQSEHGTDDFFAISCHVWKKQVDDLERSRIWLAKAGAQILQVRFEDVIVSLDGLRIVWDWIGLGRWDEYADRNADLIRTPINARTNASRIVSTARVWDAWDRDQRETFEKICGDSMNRFGYALPPH